jgi:hypothetical protein
LTIRHKSRNLEINNRETVIIHKTTDNLNMERIPFDI